MRMLRTLVLCATFVTSAAAQGTLSTQGFGYPAGGLSTHAEGVGGSIAETDPLSPVNPASLATWGRPGLYFQYDPEFRRVQANGTSDNTTTARFPLLAGALNVGPRATHRHLVDHLLDRTWKTSSTGYAHFATGDSSLYNESFSTDGAINDVRLARLLSGAAVGQHRPRGARAHRPEPAVDRAHIRGHELRDLLAGRDAQLYRTFVHGRHRLASHAHSCRSACPATQVAR